MLRALFQVNSVERYMASELVKASPVFCGRTHMTQEEEDACESHAYAKASPSGSFTLQIDNPRARGMFQPGMKVYLDLTLMSTL